MRLRSENRWSRGVLPLCALAAYVVTAANASDAPLSPRNANYRIDVSLDVDSKILQGRQRLTWTNITDQRTRTLVFHLYWNAWRNNQSTWLREDQYRGRSDLHGKPIAAEDWSYLEIDSIRLVGVGGWRDRDLAAEQKFLSPDDGNASDRTLLSVELPRPVRLGETVVVEMDWRAKVPRTFARTGYRGDFYFIAHWFPKLSVFLGNRWNAHQFHAGTEFFSDFGVYDVSINLPSEFVVGATGREISRREEGDGTTTHRYRQADVHGFTWTASPDYEVYEERFEEDGLPPVDMRLLMQPEHRGQRDRHFAAVRATLKSYGEWYGPYPYGHVTVVDPAFGSGAGGMEYPTLFTAGTRLFNPLGSGSPESVTIHEAGHQFWYGMVANNEFRDAWIDEGINTYSTARTLHQEYGERIPVHRFFAPRGTDIRGFLPVLQRGFDYGGVLLAERVNRVRSDADSDPLGVPSFRYHPATGSSLSYSKTALWLATLENYLGWDSLQQVLSTFFERWKYRHPGRQDFVDVTEEIADKDVGPFLQQVFGSHRFDYGIDSVASRPVELQGWSGRRGELELHAGGENDREPVFRSEVVVRRHGTGVFPVDVLFVFEDGKRVRKSWDGKARWRLFVEEHNARLEYAEVDPDRVLMLDLHPSNNSRMVEPEPLLPTVKWATRWMVWFQDYLAAVASFV